MAQRRPREVFVSHSNTDRSIASEFVRVLRQHGIKVWFSPIHIHGAQQWHDEIGRALDRCDWFIVLLTPASVRSNWVQREYLYALNDARYRSRITPVLIKTCSYQRLSWTIDQIQFVDFRKSRGEGFRRVLQRWGIEMSDASAKPNRRRRSLPKKRR